MSASVRPRLADLISFGTLAAAVAAMALSMDGHLRLAGGLILLGYLLDGVDGEAARRLGGFSEFGTQLDSLIDVVHFGAANSILISRHLSSSTLAGWPIWLLLAGYLFAASYRLARFNLAAGHNNKQETVGLTISTGGAFLAIVVLADLAFSPRLIPDWAYLPLLAVISLLMVSRIPFPDVRGLRRYRTAALVTFAAGGLLALWFPFEAGLLLVWSVYVLFGIARAGRRRLRGTSARERQPDGIDQGSTA